MILMLSLVFYHVCKCPIRAKTHQNTTSYRQYQSVLAVGAQPLYRQSQTVRTVVVESEHSCTDIVGFATLRVLVLLQTWRLAVQLRHRMITQM